MCCVTFSLLWSGVCHKLALPMCQVSFYLTVHWFSNLFFCVLYSLPRFLFNQCPTLFASVCFTRHHLGKGIKDLLWIKSQPCTALWQCSKNLNYCFNNNVDSGLSSWRYRQRGTNQLTCRYSYTDMHTCITLYSWRYELCVPTNVFHCSSFISCNCAAPDSGNSETPCIRLEGCFVKPHGRVSRWKDCSCSTRDGQEGISSGDI